MAPRAAVTPITERQGNIAASVHPRYTAWLPIWRSLGYVYEGDGPFLDGSVLIPYPREVNYQKDPKTGELVLGADQSPVFVNYTQKFLRRKQLFSYDNIAAEILNCVVDHQYQKMPDREPPESASPSQAVKDYLDWAENDVDGTGTGLDDWMKQTGRLAAVYGHLFVTLERAESQAGEVRTAADLGPLVLRRYTPLDAPDWILDSAGRLKEIKLIEAVPRDTLLTPAREFVTTPSVAASTDTSDAPEDYEIRRWTKDGLIAYDRQGHQKRTVKTDVGQPPVLVFYSKRRARVPLIGRSLLGDPRIYCDHANIASEMRELMRSQTFSMLAIGLGEEQQVTDARAILGEHSGTDKLVFHRSGAEFIAPPDGPLQQYIAVADRAERKMFKAVGLGWDGDSREAETAASRRIKAMDLNRVLAGMGDEAETFEYSVARLWLMSNLGREQGIKEFDTSNLRCAYPDEYFVDSALDRLEEIRQTQGLGFGTTFDTMIRQQAVPVILPGIDDAKAKVIGDEIAAEAERSKADEVAMSSIQQTHASNEAEMIPPSAE